MNPIFASMLRPRKLARLPFVLWTITLLLAANVWLRVVLAMTTGEMYPFPDGWHFLDPLGLILSEGPRLSYTLIVHVLLTMGLVLLGVNRARDAGWKPATGALMILPVVRLFVFVALAVAPTPTHTDVLDLPRGGWLERVIPRSRIGSAVAAILLTMLLVLPLGFIGVRLLEDYGLALFIGLPFLLGMLSASLDSYHQPRSLKQSLGVATVCVAMALGMTFMLAMEGLLCIGMAAPIVYLIAMAGALIGHSLGQRARGRARTMQLLILLTPCLMAFEGMGPRQEPLFSVVTAVRINAPPQQVWDQLVQFSRMDEPDELIFKAGISYPIEARITGTGVGACRYCEFNTGPFVEPITTWDEPTLLAFDVIDDPPPMTELSIYEHIEAPHVEGFFRSRNGQFALIELNDGSTLLEGTTWYTHDIWPEWYWKLWSDWILHTIHLRVLEHIKARSEP